MGALVVVLRRRPRPESTPFPATETLLGGAIGLLGGVTLWILWPLLGVEERLGPARAALGLAGAGWWWMLAYLGTVNAWIEDSFWEGRGEPRWRPTTRDALFAGFHGWVLAWFLDWPWVAVCVAVLTGVRWGWRFLAVRAGRAAVRVSHGAADLSIMVAVALRTL